MLHLNFSGVTASGKTTTARTLFDGFLGERKEWASGGCGPEYMRAALSLADVLVLDDIDRYPFRAGGVDSLIQAVTDVQRAGKLRCKLLITTSEEPVILPGADAGSADSAGYRAMAQTLNNPKVMRE